MVNLLVAKVADQTVTFVSDLVSQLTGVELGINQADMVRSRLFKHLSDIGISDTEYPAFFQKNQASETQALVSLLTTHHSYFFREYAHFEYLESKTLPSLIEVVRQRGDRTIRVWSAASSRGQEVYSLSMCLNRFLKENAPDLRYEILGSDVDEKSVMLAKNGVYLRNEMKEIPMAYLGDHWARGTGDISNFVKAKKSIKDPCSFEVCNLLTLSTTIRPFLFDIIFCRNVFIYFSLEQVSKVTKDFMKMLSPQGQLFVGISESLRGHGLPVHALGPSIYTHEKQKDGQKISLSMASESPAASVRVVCVDDSPSILLLLKKILTRENGFEVVGTATNGLEAQAQIQALKPDLVTLDIHMPVQDGLEYLSKNMRPGHPPVVMVTSVSRDSVDLAHKAIELGAVDFVEKPALSNLRERSDEIRTKLRTALRAKATQVLRVDQEFKKSSAMKYASNQLRVIIVEKSQTHKLSWILDQFKGEAPPTLVVSETYPKGISNLEILGENTLSHPLSPNRIYQTPWVQCPFLLRRIQTAQRMILTTSVLVFGPFTPEIRGLVATWPKSQLLLEDQGGSSLFSTKENEAGHFVDVVPATSFAYMSQEFFSNQMMGHRMIGSGGGK